MLQPALQEHEPTGSLLELGAGSGAMAESMARRWPDLRLTATDIDPAMTGAATRRLAGLSNAEVRQADATALPFDDGRFDVVTSFLMLHHVVDWEDAVREAIRVLKPGGTLVGYDLDRTPAARFVHWVDRSPHNLIPCDVFERSLDGVGEVTVRRTLAKHVYLFTARKAPGPVGG